MTYLATCTWQKGAVREQRGAPGAPEGPLMDLANPFLKMLSLAAIAERAGLALRIS